MTTNYEEDRFIGAMSAGWIRDLESSDSRLHKEAVIEKALMAAKLGSSDAQAFLFNCYQAYNPFYTFHIKQVPEVSGHTDRPNAWPKFWALLESLRTRSVTGHSALAAVDETSELFDDAEWNMVCRRVIIKDLRCGISEKTLNKVLKNSEWRIPVFTCQLAQDSTDQPKKLTGVKRLEPKLDGVRVLAVVQGMNVSLMSRNGKEFANFPDIARDIMRFRGAFQHGLGSGGRFVLDGEVTGESFQKLMKQAHRKSDAKTDGMMAVGRGVSGKSRRTLTGVPCKLGVMWSFDAAKGDFLWAKSTIYQNLVKGIDNRGKVTVDESQLLRDLKKTYHHCPPHAGGRDWPFTAYSPQHNVMYVMLQNMCADYRVRADNIPSKPADQYNTIGPMVLTDGKSNIGRIDAISVETGKTLWSWETPASNYSSILATAGGVIFNGDMARNFRALDQESGKVLWQTRLGSQVEGTPVTFSTGGRQYIAIVAGGGYNAGPLRIRPDIDQVSGGNMVYVFALPQ